MANKISETWEFAGEAYFMSFKFPKSFIQDHGFLTPADKERWVGGPGCIIFVDYRSSNIGPYQELLFLPGKVKAGGRKFFTITKAFVSSQAALEHAKENWGIPKELADFHFEKGSKDIETLKVTRNNVPVIEVTVQSSGMAFSFRSWMMPAAFLQHSGQRDFSFKLKGGGKARFAQNMKVDVNPELFPNFAFFKHIAVLRIDRFKLMIPPAKIRENPNKP